MGIGWRGWVGLLGLMGAGAWGNSVAPIAPLPVAQPRDVLAAAGCDDLKGRPINIGVRWNDVWQALEQGANCTQNCHLGSLPSADLDLGNRTLSVYFLVGQQSSQDDIARVDPGNPAGSLLFQKISCSKPAVGRPMPAPFGHLPIPIQELMYDWIEQGAYGEPGEDPIPRDYMFRDSLESLRR
jgi:hypothetical protein